MCVCQQYTCGLMMYHLMVSLSSCVVPKHVIEILVHLCKGEAVVSRRMHECHLFVATKNVVLSPLPQACAVKRSV